VGGPPSAVVQRSFMSSPRHRYVATRPAPPTNLRRLGPRRWAYHQPVRPRRTMNSFLRVVLALGLLAIAMILVGILGYKLWVDGQTEHLIYAPDNPSIPQRHVAMVFGAGLNPSGGPSAMLYDRIATAAELYDSGRVGKLLMTGDNGEVSYNEVEVMRQTAVELGVLDEDIVLDYAGFSTWDSCYRAREVFGLAEATLVTQRFHLPRAVFTCRHLGIDAIGVASDLQPYPTSYNELRELPALAATFWNITTDRQPKFLGPKVNVDEPQGR
jgi:vancomycin permeability regulator SanA